MGLDFLLDGIAAITWKEIVMYCVGIILIYLAIAKQLEPTLLLPMGFGAILVNIQFSSVLTQGSTIGAIEWLFDVGINVSEILPLLLFIGIGAMLDFGPLLSNPRLIFIGVAAQAGISVFPMTSRIVHQLGVKEDKGNYLLMHAASANIAGQVASAIAGGVVLSFFM